MQTGQNSIAPENSLPQLGQVRWGPVLILPPVSRPQSETKRTPYAHQVAGTWPYSGWHPAVLLHGQSRVALRFRVIPYSGRNSFREPPPMRRADIELRRCRGSKITSVGSVASWSLRSRKQDRLASPRRFIHAETSPPGDRKARLQESTPDSTFPNPPGTDNSAGFAEHGGLGMQRANAGSVVAMGNEPPGSTAVQNRS